MRESFLVACVQNRANSDMSASIAQCERLDTGSASLARRRA